MYASTRDEPLPHIDSDFGSGSEQFLTYIDFRHEPSRDFESGCKHLTLSMYT